MSPWRDTRNATALVVGFVLGLLIFSQCGCGAAQRPAICQTACGMRLVTQPPAQDVYDGGPLANSTALMPWWSCENFNAIEAQSLQALYANAAPYDSRFDLHSACDALNGVTVTVRPERHWFDGSDAGYIGNDKWVVGLTICDGAPSIQVANHEPADGTITHEMAHVIQRCDPKGPPPLVGQDPDYEADSDPGHLNWGRYGIYAAETQVALIDAVERLRREDAVFACGGDAGCVAQFDAGVIP